MLILALAAPAYAEDPTPPLEISRADLADLLAKSAELAATKKQVTALEATVAAQDAQIKAQAALIKTQDDLLARQERLTGLADEERDVHKGRAERMAQGDRWLNAQAKGGLSALACVPFAAFAGPFAPAVPAACAVLGGIYGYFSWP